MKCIIVSTDPVAVDATFCRMINLKPSFVPTNKYGKMSGLGTFDLKELDYKGDSLNSFINKKFKVNRTPVGASIFRSSGRFVMNALYAKPVIVAEKCTKCGICVDECPVEGKALQFKKLNGNNSKLNKKEPPVYDYDKCIRCYCCQEMCPYKAIYLKRPLIVRILKR
jgi:ferredoxin